MNTPTSKRFEWQFDYPVKSVLNAARQKAEHHRLRLAYWKEELDRVDARLMEIQRQTAQEAQSQSGDTSFTGNPELMKRGAQCRAKLHSHRELAVEFECWVRALEARGPQDRLPLVIDDVLYFGL